MKKFLALFLLLSPLSLNSPVCLAQSQNSFTETQKKDIAKLVEKIRAKLPVGWLVEYPAKNDFLVAYEEEKTIPTFPTPPDYDRIKVYRLKKIAMDATSYAPNSNPFEGLKFADRTYRLDFYVTPFLSKKEYAQTILRNENIERQLSDMYRELSGMGMSHKFDSFLPKTLGQEVKVNQYKQLKQELVSMPEYHFQNISLTGWIFELDYYKSVRDRAIRRECALVSQSIASLLTRYKGEKFKIDQKVLIYEYPEPEPEQRIIEKEGEVPGS